MNPTLKKKGRKPVAADFGGYQTMSYNRSQEDNHILVQLPNLNELYPILKAFDLVRPNISSEEAAMSTSQNGNTKYGK